MTSRAFGSASRCVSWQDVGHLDTWLFDLDNTAVRLGTIGFDVGKFNKFHNLLYSVTENIIIL